MKGKTKVVAILAWRSNRVELWCVPDELELPPRVCKDEVVAELVKEVEKKGRPIGLFVVNYWLRRCNDEVPQLWKGSQEGERVKTHVV